MLWDPVTPSKMLQLPVLRVQLGPLWSIMAHQQRWKPSGHTWVSQSCLAGGYPSWAHRSKDEVAGPPARFASVLSSSTPAVPAGLGSPLLLGRHFAHQQLPHVWASAFCVDTLLSPGLGWLNNNIPIILSHVPVTIQISLDLHIWGGVGFGDGCRWPAASLQFAPVGKSTSVVVEMFNPWTDSVSHNKKTQLLLGIPF